MREDFFSAMSQDLMDLFRNVSKWIFCRFINSIYDSIIMIFLLTVNGNLMEILVSEKYGKVKKKTLMISIYFAA